MINRRATSLPSTCRSGWSRRHSSRTSAFASRSLPRFDRQFSLVKRQPGVRRSLAASASLALGAAAHGMAPLGGRLPKEIPCPFEEGHRIAELGGVPAREEKYLEEVREVLARNGVACLVVRRSFKSRCRCSQFPLFFMPMPLQPLLGGFLHDVRSGPVKVKRGLLDGPYDVRIHGRQELSLVALRGLSAPSWRRFVVGHRPAYAWCNPGNRPMGCDQRQGTGARAWSISPTIWVIFLLTQRNPRSRMPEKYRYRYI